MAHDTTSMPLIGRAEELDQLLSWLADDSAFIAITGSPGVGKSTLLRAAIDERVEDGEMTRLDLTSYTEERAALSALLVLLEIPPSPNQPDPDEEAMLELIASASASRERHLMVLDNAEHLLGLIEALAAKLEDTKTRLVVASRHVPTSERAKIIALTPFDPAKQAESVIALFEAHKPAHIALPHDEDPATHEALLELGVLVEGLPLSISLLASRLSMFKPGKLLERIRSRRSRDSTLGALNAALEWSWGLLDEQEQRAVMACARFQDGFGFDEAEELLARTGLEDGLGLLERLREYNLLLVEDEGERFRGKMLESVRLFALDKTKENPALEKQIHDNHASVFAERGWQLFQETRGYQWHELGPSIAREYANFSSAFEHLFADPSADTKAVLEAGLGLHLVHLVRMDAFSMNKLHERMLPHIEAASETLPADLQACYWLARATCASQRWNPREGMKFLERASALAEAPIWKLSTMTGIASNFRISTHEHARGIIEEAVPLAIELGAERERIELLMSYADTYAEAREWGHSTARFEELLEELEGTTTARRQLGRVRMYVGYAMRMALKHERAEEMFRGALEVFEEVGDIISLGHTMRMMAWYFVDEREHEKADEILVRLLELANRHALRWLQGTGLFLLGQLRVSQREFKTAIVAYERAIFHLEANGILPLVAACRLYCSVALELDGREEKARETFAKGYALFDSLHSATSRVSYLVSHARFLALDGKQKDALAKLEQAEKVIEGLENDAFLPTLIDLYYCHVHLPAYLKAKKANKVRKTKQLLEEILTRLSKLMYHDDGLSDIPLERCSETRLGWMLLEKNLPEDIQRRFTLGLEDPTAEALLLDTRSRAFRAPGEMSWIDMARRETPFRLLQTLVDHRLSHPGEAIDPHALFEEVWPDESIMPDAAQNRLYVTINTLRREGLKELIINNSGGYLLDPDVRLIEV